VPVAGGHQHETRGGTVLLTVLSDGPGGLGSDQLRPPAVVLAGPR
jgi:hypothetical protein